jgi:hypothetical protein
MPSDEGKASFHVRAERPDVEVSIVAARDPIGRSAICRSSVLGYGNATDECQSASSLYPIAACACVPRRSPASRSHGGSATMVRYRVTSCSVCSRVSATAWSNAARGTYQYRPGFTPPPAIRAARRIKRVASAGEYPAARTCLRRTTRSRSLTRTPPPHARDVA